MQTEEGKGLFEGCSCAGKGNIGVQWPSDKNSFLNPENPFLFCQDAMLVALKSLLPACLFNIIGFGSTFKSLFPSSQTYSEVMRGQGWDQEGGAWWGAEERRERGKNS